MQCTPRCIAVALSVALFAALLPQGAAAASAPDGDWIEASYSVDIISPVEFRLNATLSVRQLKIASVVLTADDMRENYAQSQNKEFTRAAFHSVINSTLGSSLEKTFPFSETDLRMSVNLSSLENGGTDGDPHLPAVEFTANATMIFNESAFGLLGTSDIEKLTAGLINSGVKISRSYAIMAPRGWNVSHAFAAGNGFEISGSNANGVISNWNGAAYKTGRAEFLLQSSATMGGPSREELNLRLLFDASDFERVVSSASFDIESVDFSGYGCLPEYMQSPRYLGADALRLIAANGVLSWSEVYNNSLRRAANDARNFSMSLFGPAEGGPSFAWDFSTTPLQPGGNGDVMDCSPAISATAGLGQGNLSIGGASPKLTLGLIEAGASAGFPIERGAIEVPYCAELRLPQGIALFAEGAENAAGEDFEWSHGNGIIEGRLLRLTQTPAMEERSVAVKLCFNTMDLEFFSLFSDSPRGSSKLAVYAGITLLNISVPEDIAKCLPPGFSAGMLNSRVLRQLYSEGFLNASVAAGYYEREISGVSKALSASLGLGINLSTSEKQIRDAYGTDADGTAVDLESPLVLIGSTSMSYGFGMGKDDLGSTEGRSLFKLPAFNLTLPSLGGKTEYRIILPRGIEAYVSCGEGDVESGMTEKKETLLYTQVADADDPLFMAVQPGITAAFVLFAYYPVLIVVFALIVALVAIAKIKKAVAAKRGGREDGNDNGGDAADSGDGRMSGAGLDFIPPPPQDNRNGETAGGNGYYDRESGYYRKY
ncbi:MAG: hypothetical protein CVT48_04760 [Thermoplasmata archaeon HGW-Thermoplasmata-1]|nr:MAG: hypothetical protein CVT48_04760 [Thermoplasmata archaeon HGW-Thermoplasmata-1]